MQLHQELARGGVGLIITGHMYIHPAGKAHPEMTGIYSDELLPGLATLADTIHHEGGLAAVQINFGGLQSHKDAVNGAIAPSDFEAPYLTQAAREMTTAEIHTVIEAFGQAARRCKQAGFDAVQIHGAHGYLINQFLSPYLNHRTDEWGGSLDKRMNFLRAVCQAVRAQVGPDYPVFIKLGMEDRVEGGLTVKDSLQVVAALQSMEIDAIEISNGFGAGKSSSHKGIRSAADEAYFLPLAQQARQATCLPILLVGGFRSRQVMEIVLASGMADFISISRPLISEPDFPNRLRLGLQDRSRCISSSNCWPTQPGTGIACKCPLERIENQLTLTSR